MPRTPPGKESVARRLGELIRAARGTRTLVELATALGWSKSTQGRFEQGDDVPDLEQARRLDEVLSTSTLVRDAVRDILFNPTRAVLSLPRKFSMTVFQPTDYVGPVYVQLAAPPKPRGVERDVRVLLHWGALLRLAPLPVLDDGFAFLDQQGFRIDGAGIALVCAKQGVDSTPLRVETSIPLMLSIASGLPLLDDNRVLDVNDGWTRGSH